jgi:hypothetical protein
MPERIIQIFQCATITALLSQIINIIAAAQVDPDPDANRLEEK